MSKHLLVGIKRGDRTLWIALAEHVWGTKGTVIHAVDSPHVLAWTKGSRRKTWDAECGARVTPYLVPVRGEEAHATPVWPPRVADLRAVGLSRCVACHKATGRKPPATSITREAAA